MTYTDIINNRFTLLCRTFSYLLNAIPDFTDNNLINIIKYGEDYYASSEVNYINQIDPLTLDTLGRVSQTSIFYLFILISRDFFMTRLLANSSLFIFQTNYRNHIALNLATAHPHYDDDGNAYNMGTAIIGFGRPKCVIFKVPANASGTDKKMIFRRFQHRNMVYCMHFIFIADKEKKKPALKKVEQICSIPFRSTLFPSYFHSFGLTENYIIFVEQAFKLDILKLATAYFRNVNWGSCLKFDKDDVVSKTTSFDFATPSRILCSSVCFNTYPMY